MFDEADIKVVYWNRPFLVVEEYKALSLFMLLRIKMNC